MSLCAILPVANMVAANASLEAQGFGPGNFSVAAYAAPTATHGALHAWNNPAFAAAVKTLPGVAWEESDGNPVTRTQALIAAQGAQWGSRAPDLPVGGDWPNGSHPVTASTLYRWTDDTLWWVIQAHDRAVRRLQAGQPVQRRAGRVHAQRADVVRLGSRWGGEQRLGTGPVWLGGAGVTAAIIIAILAMTAYLAVWQAE